MLVASWCELPRGPIPGPRRSALAALPGSLGCRAPAQLLFVTKWVQLRACKDVTRGASRNGSRFSPTVLWRAVERSGRGPVTDGVASYQQLKAAFVALDHEDRHR